MLGQEDPDYSFMIKTSEVFYWEDRIDTDRTLYFDYLESRSQGTAEC